MVAAIALAVMCVRIVEHTRHTPLTSDESLYLSEAVSIAQGRLTYASGDPIVHRPPLYPATLAPIMAATGNDVGHSRIVPLLYALGALAGLYLLVSQVADRRVAFVAVALAATAAGTVRISASYFVDTPMTMWLFLSAAVLLRMPRAQDDRRVIYAAASGALLGMSFLTKETAAVWLPLPIVLSLLAAPGQRLSLRSGAAWYGAFIALAAPWFAWVAWHTGLPFKVDSPSAAAIASCFAATIGVAAALIAAQRWSARRRCVFAMALVSCWSVLMLAGLESRPEPHPIRYWQSLPDWSRHVFATGVEPWAPVLAAWAYAGWRTVRGDASMRPTVLIAALGAPLYVYAANRGWELRQVIWLAYLSYAVLAWAAIRAVDAIAARWPQWQQQAFATAAIVSLAVVAGFASNPSLQPAGPERHLDWGGHDEQRLADWVRELPPHSTVISSRAFSAQIYVDVDGDHHIVQMPTLGVRIAGDGVRPFGTLFRYDDGNVDLQAPREWMYLRAYPGRDYAVGLSESDLIAAIREHGAGYLLLTGNDGGFSSTSYRAYFDGNPAFRLMRSHEGDTSSYLYRINREALATRRPPLVLSGEDFATFSARWGEIAASAEFWHGLAPSGVALDGYQPLSTEDAGSLAAELNGYGAPQGEGEGAARVR